MLLEQRLRSGWVAAVATLALAAGARADCGGGCGSSVAGTPADESVAARMGLVREWVAQIPFDSTRAAIEHVVVDDGLVVVQTGDGRLHAFKAGAPAGGAALWSQRLPVDAGPATSPGVGSRLVTTTRGFDLFALDRGTGAIRWQRRLGGLPEAGAVEIGDWVYAPRAGGNIERLTFDPLQPTAESVAARPAAAAAKEPRTGSGRRKQVEPPKPTEESLRPRTFTGGGGVSRPPRPLGKGVSWTTDDGILVALAPTEQGWERLEFDLNAPAVDAPLTQDRSVFAATRAGDLARVDLVDDQVPSLRTGWHVVLDAVPDAGPFLGGDTLVVSLGDAGLAAFTADTGQPRWRSPVAGRVLAVVGDRVWIVDRTHRLAGIDLATGAPRERLCLAGFTVPVTNPDADRLVLASADGLLVSLAPRRPIPPADAKPIDREGQPPAAPPANDAAPGA